MKGLTEKQAEIRDLIRSGLTYAQCAQKLWLCETSIRLQCKRILKKGFDLDSPGQLKLFDQQPV